MREIERRAPGLEVREGYGCTESGAVISSTPAGRRRLGSVGLPLPGYEVRILDEMDQEVPLGERGEICCRAPGVMLGYWDAPETTADTLRAGADELVEFARSRLSAYKYPREVHVLDDLPLTPVGKVDRKALRQRL